MRWLCLLALAGCNQVLGLDTTVLVDDNPDHDGDGLLDVVDNCPDIANPLQENGDGDELGDICDPCPTGSNHNEDGDSLLDGCDNCPHVANDDQANDDGDDLGNACDQDPRAQRRVWFDGFATLRTEWVPGQADWVAEGDAVHAVTDPVDGDPGMWNRRAEAGGASYFIETIVQVEDVDLAAAGFWTRQRPGGTEFQCYVVRTGGMWTLVLTHLALGLTTTKLLGTLPSNPLMLRLRRDGTLIHCEIAGGRISLDVVDPVTYPDLYTTKASSQFMSIDIVTTE